MTVGARWSHSAYRQTIKAVSRVCLALTLSGIMSAAVSHAALASPPYYYGIAQDDAGSLGLSKIDGAEATQYLGHLSLSDYTNDHLIQDLWVADNQSPNNWVESGIVVGTLCTYAAGHTSTTCDNGSGTESGPYKIPRFEWGDQRPTGGYHMHVDVSDTPDVGYYVDSIRYAGSDTWNTSIGQGSTNWTGTSSSNTMVAVVMQAGIEIEANNESDADACTGQSNLSYWDNNNTFQSDWPHAITREIGSGAPPPYSEFVGDAQVHSWSGDTSCY